MSGSSSFANALAFANWLSNIIFVSVSSNASLFSNAAKKDVGDIPAAFDICAVVVFAYPCSQNSCIAARSILFNYNIDMEMSTLIGIIYENISLILSQYFLLLYKTYKSDKN